MKKYKKRHDKDMRSKSCVFFHFLKGDDIKNRNKLDDDFQLLNYFMISLSKLTAAMASFV